MSEEKKMNALNDDALDRVTGGARGSDGEIVDDGSYYCFDCKKWGDAIWLSNDVVCAKCHSGRVTTVYVD